MDETPAQVAPAEDNVSEATNMDESPAQVTPAQVKTSEKPLLRGTQASCVVPKTTKATSTTQCSQYCSGYGFCFEGPNGGQGNPPGFGAALYTCYCYTSGCQVNFDNGRCNIRSALQSAAGNTTHMDETPAQVSEATHMDE